MSEHSILSPSSAARRIACPGSRALQEQFPQEDSPATLEGRAAHELAAWKLQFFAHDPNGIEITDEMREGAELYRDHVHSVLKDVVGSLDLSKLQVERRVDISTIHPACFGTPDCWLYYADTLHIWDYKFGHGYVDVYENWQLIEYVAGILDQLKIDGADVYLHIVQPRCYHRDGQIRTWKTKASDLRPYFNLLRDAEEKAMQPVTACHPNPLCATCTARHACPTLQQAAANVTDVSLLNVPLHLGSGQIGAELRYLQRAHALLEARLSGLSEQALVLLKRGERVPHFKIDESPGRETWKVPAAEVAALGDMFGIPLAKPLDVITPKQAIKAGLPVDFVKLYTAPSRYALKLAPDDGTTARKIFGGEK